MAWVYISIAVGAAGFLVWIVIDYVNASAGLKPKAELARHEIRECEARIGAEQVATETTKQDVESLQKEIAELEKELVEVGKKVEEYRQRERRRKPTKFKLEE
jgi:septal ring factor EnvC (AmiA/AmiB activator)